MTHSTVIDRWDENAEAEDQALAEIDDLLDGIGAIDPAAIGDGAHETQFWPAVLGRWLYRSPASPNRICRRPGVTFRHEQSCAEPPDFADERSS